MDEELVLSEYRGVPQRRTGRPSDWTKAMADAFIETLADTCNVTLAAASIKRSLGNVYKWKAKDASFRAAWDRALAMGYSRLELMLLERALHGVEKVIVARDGTSTTMRDYPDRVALTLLRMHRAEVSEQEATVDSQEITEARERIMARIERLRARKSGRKGSNSAGAEHKAAGHERMVRLADLVIALRGGRGV